MTFDDITFDDILASRDLIDGVWDTQRFAQTLDASVSAATKKKIERSLKDRGLLFPIASDETVMRINASKNSVLRSSGPAWGTGPVWRPMNPMASTTSDSMTGVPCASGFSQKTPSATRPSITR